MSATTSAQTYDEIPFPTQPLSQTHPDRLATVARLFGMRPRPIDRCRVLELGCGTGDNLIPMAERHPDSHFVGIDYSQQQILTGRRAVQLVGLPNVRLEHLSITDLGDELGEFDYILCHGVYSWVPADVQEKILAVCGKHLADQGVAYVSYNTLPGWYLRGMLRDLLVGASSPEQAPRERVATGRQVLEFVAAAIDADDTPYARLLKPEIDIALRQPDSYLFHEYFEEINEPLYFPRFVDRAARHHLQYLGDASITSMFSANFGPEKEARLHQISRDIVSMEQYMDVLRNRPFRQTLLCRDSVSLNRQITPASVAYLYLAADWQPQSEHPDLRSDALEYFVSPTGASIASPRPVVKAAFAHLSAIWPASTTLPALVAAAGELLGTPAQPAEISPEERETLGHHLVQCMAIGLVRVTSAPDRFVASCSERPQASYLARCQARVASQVTNRRHELVKLDDIARNILQYLDGQHDRDALLNLLLAAVDSGALSVMKDGLPAGRGPAVEQMLSEALDDSLVLLASKALLVE